MQKANNKEIGRWNDSIKRSEVEGKFILTLKEVSFFKYQILKQYEDALDSIEFKKKISRGTNKKYHLEYFISFETKESPYLLNFEHIVNPFFI